VIVGALDFALLGMILYAWNGFKADNDKQQKLIIEGITMIFILALLLGGNGVLTSNILAITHAFDVNLNRNLAELQVIDSSIANSLKNISLSNTAKDRVDNAFVLSKSSNFLHHLSKHGGIAAGVVSFMMAIAKLAVA
jgi:hypothetical protein